ncbi:hypothetical protein S7711_07179 [Stachybotrys chartarum IBT 7711]|uniref:Dethiobiotin synthase n=1 Tax=Stachybotrys chartarum (strain CBS 109288 / IBT 7711) TaxID=1280523 RepID=A0A084BAJ8_STACB|nr:hypothetical protein S7711_07179 [Stachybotrys chartarum IBT 7711]
MNPLPALMWRNVGIYHIFGANTDVGKTIFATALCRAASALYTGHQTSYLKPVSTGPEDEADARHVKRYATSVTTETLFQWERACSPHLAAKESGQVMQPVPSDDAVLAKITSHVSAYASSPGWLFLETAGGVHSPGPSGTTQADLFAPLRAPVILVGDAKLGGISQTISAFESLKIRGYDVDMVLLLRNAEYDNHVYLREYFASGLARLPVETLAPPPDRVDGDGDRARMESYYESATGEIVKSKILSRLEEKRKARMARLDSMAESASARIWYPFTQQKLLTPDKIAVIDSAHGDFFQILAPGSSPSALQPAFDGSASWWTQGLGHGSSQLSLAAAYAAGRYGHVMFAGAIHEPALTLAETLLCRLDNPRLARVFYSDNGSTGCEVAIKMALRASRVRYGWEAREDLEVLGLRGSYHGDTIGAMDASEPNTFNSEVEWYKGKGYWFDYPTVECSGGEWTVEWPEAMKRDGETGNAKFASLSDVFDLGSRSRGQDVEAYRRYIRGVLEGLKATGRKFGALMLEPVALGAGGMILVDPLFQKTLVDVVRESPHLFGQDVASTTQKSAQSWSGLPVIFDEVFTGLYRLGRFSSASFLHTHPDISVHAKLLTGGLVPLCTTLASEAVFDAFASDRKTDALLHGHSYTAHAVGCLVAVESLGEMMRMEEAGAWDWAKSNGWTGGDVRVQSAKDGDRIVWSVWSADFVGQISRNTAKVTGTWALGSVLVVKMRSKDGAAGYESNSAAKLQEFLRRGDGTPSFIVHSRVLGNVLYIMAGQKTSQETVEGIQKLILEALDV